MSTFVHTATPHQKITRTIVHRHSAMSFFMIGVLENKNTIIEYWIKLKNQDVLSVF